MDRSLNTDDQQKLVMPTCSLDQQIKRQRNNGQLPRGFERYQYMLRLHNAMSELGTTGADVYGNPDRYLPVGPLEEDNPIR